MEPFYCWIDIETTGLNPERDCILEVAAVVTDRNLMKRIDETSFVVSPATSPDLDPYVREMHTKNGLLAESLASGLSYKTVEAEVSAFVAAHTPTGKKLHLAGSSVHFDRSFLKVWMPKVVEQLHYRQLDVSSLKLVFDPLVPCPKGAPAHRALADIEESIREARWYMNRLVVATEAWNCEYCGTNAQPYVGAIYCGAACAARARA